MKIQILSVNQLPDGSLNADIDYDEEAAEYIKGIYGVSELTPDVLNRFVVEALSNYIEENDGPDQASGAESDDNEPSKE